MLSPSSYHTHQDSERPLLLRRMAKQRSLAHRRQRQPPRRSVTPTPIDKIKQATTTSHDTKRQQAKKKKAKEQRQRRNKAIAAAALRARREQWAEIALETQGIVLGDGKYVEERPALIVDPAATHTPHGQGPSTVKVMHDIASAVTLSRQRTVFYPHYSSNLAKWQDAHPAACFPSMQVEFVDRSTLNTARALSLSRTTDPMGSTDIGVLSFASAKHAGGGYLRGSSEQEDTIARLSSLVASLESQAARDFYQEHRSFRKEDGSGLHDHSIVYSPGVVVFRKDQNDSLPNISAQKTDASRDDLGGGFIPPYTINIVSAVAVNAAAVRSKHTILPDDEQVFEDGIRHAMKERMARVLRAFEAQGDKVLVLGAFGCGSSENKVDMVASIWAELLVCGDTVDNVKKDARFKHSFERIVFAVPGKLYEPFMQAFQMRVDEERLIAATLDNCSTV